MGEDKIRLDHIALYVTDLSRSRRFYQDILKMEVSEPISLREQSKGLKYGHSLIEHGPQVLKSWIQKSKPAAVQQMYTDICHCSAADGKINLILVQQTHPEKGYTRSVTGNTLYGFAFHLSPDVDTDDLGWDMEIADISFEHGDSWTDGTTFTPDNPYHSLYIRDPDGRMIELLPDQSGETGDFITSCEHVVLYVKDTAASIRYYQTLGLSDITPPSMPRDSWKKMITWLGNPGEKPVLILYQVTKPDGSRVEAGGYGLDHIALSGISSGGTMIPDPACVGGHPPDDQRKTGGYLLDPDGYYIEQIE